MQNHALGGGFTNAPVDSSLAFRAALDVMARPGKIVEISGATPPAEFSVATGCLLLTLCDPETPLWIAPGLRGAAVVDWLRFHTGAPLTEDRAACMFAVGQWEELVPIGDFPIGSVEYPDRSATLIVQRDTLANDGVCLRGPGIETRTSLNLPEVKSFQDNASLFPLGLDFFFTSGKRIAALPCTTALEG